MIIFPQVAKNLVLIVADLIYSDCRREDGLLAGSRWVFSDGVEGSLRTLLSLGCVPGHHSIQTLADLIMDLDYDFEGEI